mmetsp:Transcript_74605/g.198484  ORF Transcript_74605/g.198484 Transcript_74605/m.198484 type:complete len:323 (+) Transcript_74605:214-1182(+)
MPPHTAALCAAAPARMRTPILPATILATAIASAVAWCWWRLDLVFVKVVAELLALLDGADEHMRERVVEAQRLGVGDDRVIDPLLRAVGVHYADDGDVEFVGLAQQVGVVEHHDQVGRPRHRLHTAIVVGLLQVDILEPAGRRHARVEREPPAHEAAPLFPVGQHAGDPARRQEELTALLADDAREALEHRLGGDEEGAPAAKRHLLQQVERLAHREQRLLWVDHRVARDVPEKAAVARGVARAQAEAQEGVHALQIDRVELVLAHLLRHPLQCALDRRQRRRREWRGRERRGRGGGRRGRRGRRAKRAARRLAAKGAPKQP